MVLWELPWAWQESRELHAIYGGLAICHFCICGKNGCLPRQFPMSPKWVGAFAAALGGLDTLVFAGGIGEDTPTAYGRICDGLGFLGIELEENRNAANEGVISAAASRVAVRVIRTDEEQMIARSVCHALGLGMASEKRNSDHATKYISQLDPFSVSGVPRSEAACAGAI